MKTQFLKLAKALRLVLAASTMVGLVAACGGRGITDDEQAAVKEKNNKLEGDYKQVVGTYVGEVKTSSAGSALKSEVSLYINFVQDGVDQNGQPKLRPVLKGRFRLLEVVGELDYQYMDVDYKSDSGETVMILAKGSATRCVVGPQDPEFSMRGSLLGDHLTVKITRGGGVWGYLEAARVNQEATVDPEQARKQLAAAYEKLAGTYNGDGSGRVQVAPGRSDRQDFIAQFLVRKVESATVGVDGTSLYCPSLSVVMKTRKIFDGMTEITLKTVYNSATGVLSMRELADSGRTAPGVGLWSITGLLNDQGMDVMMTDRIGLVGRFKGSTKNPEPVWPKE